MANRRKWPQSQLMAKLLNSPMPNGKMAESPNNQSGKIGKWP